MITRTQTILTILTALLALSPWLYVHTQAMVNGNVAWLLIAAGRMLDGLSMAQSIYETNPPMSILFYTPHVLAMRFFHLPPEIGPPLVTALMLLLSLLASAKILKGFEYLNALERNAVLIAQTVALTSLSAIYFMDREHLMLMALIPFLLSQLALTEKRPPPPALLWPVMIAGAFAVLVKPHYGLLPAALILHRLIAHRNLNLLRQPDFAILAIATLAYIALIALAFRDYLEIILPDVLDYYAGQSNKAQTFRLFKPHVSVYLILLFAELLLNDLDKPKKRLLIVLYACALLALVPLLVQMKGFYNHLLPAFGFGVIAISLSAVFRLERLLGKRTTLLTVLVPLMIVGIPYLLVKPAWKYPGGYEIAHMPVARFLNENCPQPCSFFAFHGDIETMNPTSFYTGYTHGTRFPSYWMLPRLLWEMEKLENGGTSSSAPGKLEETKQKYALFAAQDLENFKPKILLIGTNIDILGKGEFFDYVAFFSANETFRKTLAENYEKTDTFEFDRAEYFRGTSLGQTFILSYDVYRRKDLPD